MNREMPHSKMRHHFKIDKKEVFNTIQLIKKGKKTPPAGCRDDQNCISIKANHNCRSRSQNPPLHMGISPGEKLKKTTGPRLSSEPKFDPIKNGKKPSPAGCCGYQN